MDSILQTLDAFMNMLIQKDTLLQYPFFLDVSVE